MRDLGIEIFRRTGLAELSRILFARRGRFVLEFHGVARERRADLPRRVQPSFSRDELSAALRWLRERFRFLTPEELLAGRADGVLLTFDDGYANQGANALPLLEEHEAPAVFFVATRHVADPGDWLPAVRRAAADCPGPLSPEIRRDLFDGMPANELRTVASSPFVTLGSHTVSHPLLTRCSEEDLVFELAESKRFLEEIGGRPVELFAYPSGDYDRRVAEAVRGAGYRAAFVEESRRLGLGRFEIPRVGLYAAGPGYLAAKLCGLHRRPLRRSYDDDAS
jgi:peptidoglycan/xylan/chitin deacetylase (PgdA/CDA1 family)